MYILVALATAIIGTFIWWRFAGDSKKYHWMELTGQLILSFLVAYGVGSLGLLIQGSDTEYWGDLLTKVVYEAPYEDYIYDPCCTTHSCNCTTDKDGNRSCQTCCDGCWKCVTRGNNRYKVGISGTAYRTNKAEYNRVVKSLGHSAHQKDEAATAARRKKMNHTSSCNRDDGVFRADWERTIATAENIVSEHTYENQVRYSNSAYGFEKPSDEFAADWGLVNYNSVRSYYQPDVHGNLGRSMPGYQEAVRQLAYFNGRHGKEMQIKVMVFVIPYKEDVLFWQKQWLEGGNKNEFIIALAVDEKHQVVEMDVISWTESFDAIDQVKYALQEYEGDDLEEMVKLSLPIIEKRWQRREFTPLNAYVHVEPPLWVIIMGIVIQGLVGWGLFVLFQTNYFDEGDELRTY